MHPSTRPKIFEAAKEWIGTRYQWGGDSKSGIDCSHFVWEVYKAAVYPKIPYIFSDPGRNASFFKRVKEADLLPGDLVVWKGHIAIVVDPKEGTFIGAQCSTGVAIANFKHGYWAGVGVQYFLQSKF